MTSDLSRAATVEIGVAAVLMKKDAGTGEGKSGPYRNHQKNDTITPMSNSEIEASLFESLRMRLANDGFHPQKRTRRFIKKFSGGFFGVHLTIIKHSGDLDTIVDFAIRHNNIENIINSHYSLLTDQDKKRSCSIGNELGNHLGIGQKRWTLVSVDQCPSVSTDIYDAYKRFIEPYFMRYSVLENIFDTLTAETADHRRLHSCLRAERASKSVVIAYLLKKYEEIGKLVDRGRIAVGQSTQFEIDYFEAICRDINQRIRAELTGQSG